MDFMNGNSHSFMMTSKTESTVRKPEIIVKKAPL